MQVQPLTHDVANMCLKNNKAIDPNGLPDGLFLTVYIKLIGRMHQLIYKIWLEESIPNYWNLSFLYHILEKGDPTICTNQK